jgi:hypothetical protein
LDVNFFPVLSYSLRKELEQKLKDAKKRKKEKFALKLKAMEEISEKEKNKWKNFNSKVNYAFLLKLRIKITQKN